MTADVAVIVVSHGDSRWLAGCVGSLRSAAAGLACEVLVVENGDEAAAREVLAAHGEVRLLTCENRGFAEANNRGLAATDSRYVLFLNPDTEFRQGSLAALVERLEARPQAGLAGTRQVGPDGELQLSMRRFPSVRRAWLEALGADRLGWGERVRDAAAYDREEPCDWVSGSFMLARREALAGVGGFDDGYFLFSEETDLCLRLRRAGWEIVHLPQATIVHHHRPGADRPDVLAHASRSRLRYAGRHLGPVRRAAYLAGCALGLALRAARPGGGAPGQARRRAARAGLAALRWP